MNKANALPLMQRPRRLARCLDCSLFVSVVDESRWQSFIDSCRRKGCNLNRNSWMSSEAFPAYFDRPFLEPADKKGVAGWLSDETIVLLVVCC